MKEEIKKIDNYSDSARFLAKYNITTLTEIKKYKSSVINKIVELKGLRENLWRKHKRIKTNEEGQFIYDYFTQVRFYYFNVTTEIL